jgi:hypothetical protein
METFVTHASALLVGIFSGSAATYFGQVFIDQRKRREDRQESLRRFRNAHRMMPKLIGEMKSDHANPLNRYRRDFYLLRRNGAYCIPDPDSLAHYFDDHESLHDQVKILVDYGFVTDITESSIPKYRMSDDFVQYLLSLCK